MPSVIRSLYARRRAMTLSGYSGTGPWRVMIAGLALASFHGVGVSAQTPDYFTVQPFELRWNAELELRQEWTEAFGLRPGADRRRARLLGGAEGRYRWLSFGLTGDFVYSSDDNVAGLGGPGAMIQRDNYRSRDARVDSVFLSAEPARWLRLEAGRFEMPIDFTGLLWDPDLRPQGAALALNANDIGALGQLSLTALGARGSHVFDDSQTTMWAVAGEAVLELGERNSLDLTAAFVTWTDVAKLERPLWRQNTVSPKGVFGSDYEVLDFVARLHRNGDIEAELVVDVCRNLGADEGQTGVWLSVVLDAAVSGWPRLAYLYVWVDRDATLAAFPADDYLWTTGWEGHELELGLQIGDYAVVRAIGQLQRYKDAPQQRFRDDWVGRARVEFSLRY